MINLEDNLIVYRDTTPMIPEGGFVKVLDTSSDDPDSFLVAKISDIAVAEKRHGHDPNSLKNVLIFEHSFWVKKENVKLVNLDKPKSIWQRIIEFFGRKNER